MDMVYFIVKNCNLKQTIDENIQLKETDYNGKTCKDIYMNQTITENTVIWKAETETFIHGSLQQ